MDFKQYQYVLAIAEMRSFTKAAQFLYVSQPALSAYIAKLEEDLGVSLFDRSKTPIGLTPAGEIVAEAGRKVLALQHQMNSQLFELSAGRKGRISIGLSSSRGTYLLPLVYPRFCAEYPEVKLETVEEHYEALTEAVLRGTIDLAMMPQVAVRKELLCRPLEQEELLLIARRGCLTEADCLTPDTADLRRIGRIPFILLRKEHGIRKFLEQYFEEQEFSPRTVFETSSNSTALRMVAAGQGLAIVPRMTLDLAGDPEGIDVLHLSPEGLFWQISAVIQRSRRDEFILNEFIRIAAEAIKTARS